MAKRPRYQHFDERRYARAVMRFYGWELLALSVVFALIALGAFVRGNWLYGLLLLIFIGVLDVVMLRLGGRSRRRDE